MSDADPQTRAAAARSFAPLWLGVAAICAFALHEALQVARAEWFSRDDFALLLYVQRPWSWLDAFLPIERSFWWTYRPLGMDAFFRLAFQAFGLDAFRWFAVELAVHAALGPATFLLARRLGFERPAAVVAGALAILAHPSLGGLYYASVFHYVAANLLGALALLLFHAGVRGTARLPLVGAAIAFAAALLCNEAALVIPGVALLLALRSSGPSRRGLGGIATSVAPLFLLAAIYGVLRLAVFELSDPPAAYAPRLRGNLLRHFWMQPMWLAGGRGRLVLALVSMGAMLGAVLHAARTEPEPLRRLLRDYALLGPWLLAAIAVFALLPFSHPRFAITLQLPGALLVGAHLDALWRVYGARWAGTFQAACIVLLLLALPLDAMRQRAAAPWGGPARDFVEGIGRVHPRLPPGTELVVLHGEGLASRVQMERVRRLTYGGSAIKAVRPGERLGAVRFVEVAAARSEPRCARCVHVALGADLKIRAAPLP